LLTIVDEATRACLASAVARRLRADDVLHRLAECCGQRGVPACIRAEAGPEFTAKAVRPWLSRLGVRPLDIEPGSPGEHGDVERCNGTLRDDVLNGDIFHTLLEARIIIKRWRQAYNEVRPHSALGYRPPAPEAIEPQIGHQHCA